ncbi:MAG TPA: response regulator [Bacteroidota bacterium]
MTEIRNYGVLLVEDDSIDAELALKVFKKLRIETRVTVASDGLEALIHIFGISSTPTQKLEHLPKVIFLDLKLPRMDGFEVLRRLKADDRSKTIPVVILTSSGEERDIRRAYELQANGYVIKPVDAERYEQVIAAIVEYWVNINESREHEIHDVLATN